MTTRAPKTALADAARPRSRLDAVADLLLGALDEEDRVVERERASAGEVAVDGVGRRAAGGRR